jgi:ribosome-associated protein
VKVIESKKKALAMARAASDKKALEIVIVDMRKVPGICDYFLIASGTSTTQVRAISDNIIRKFKESGQRLYHAEGEIEASWILLDYGDVVGHIFYDETRRFYDLERLWGDAPQKRFKERAKRRTGGRTKKRKRDR